MTAPIGRIASVTVIVSAMSGMRRPNSATIADHEDQHEEVEGVERPAEEAGETALRASAGVMARTASSAGAGESMACND